MARQVLTVAGFAAGFFLPGGPAVWGAVGAAIGGAVDPEVIKGPRIGEANTQTSAEGAFRPIVFCKGAVKGNIHERINRQIKTQRTSQSKGSGPVSENERVYWTFGIRISEGPIGGVPRIWMGEKLAYDVTPGSTILAESAEFAERFRLYLGDETQLPDPDLEAVKGVGNVNAYRGTAYIVFPNFDLTDFGETIPQFRFEVSNQTFTPYNYLALLHMDEKYTDSGVHVRDEVDPTRWSPGGDLVPATSPFGENALEIGGLSDLSYANTDFATMIGVSPFCFAGWGFMDSSVPIDHVHDTMIGHWYQPGTRAFSMTVRRAGTKNFFVQLSTDGTNTVSIQGDIEVPLDEWVYLAVTRDSDGIVSLWQGGIGETCVLVGQGFFPYAIHSNAGEVPGENWVIGGFDNIVSANIWRGLIKEFVIIVGDPVYTEPFPAPTAPWPNPTESPAVATMPLSEIVADLHQRVGHTANDYDVSELTDGVEGLVLADDYNADDAIRILMPTYRFDSSEYDDGSGYRIHYLKRGKPIVGTVTIDDLVEAPEKTTREDSLELPLVMHLSYQNPTIGYAPAKATARRDSPDVKVVGERSLQVPVVFSDVDEPAKIAHRLLKVAYVERGGEEEITVHDGLLEWVPGDCIGLTLRGQTRRMRIVQEQIGAGEIKWKLIPDRQSAYTSNVTGVAPPPPTPPIPSIAGPTIHELMDLPALNDGNDRLIWDEAATGQTPAWYGAQTQRKIAPATEFTNSARFTQNTIMGVLLDDITSASEFYTDTTNVVRVQLYTDDVIDTLTDEQYLNEGGGFALKKADGTWEILRYRDSVDEGSGVFALSHLGRGQLNTGASEHLSGVRFVLLDGVQAVDATTSMIGADIVTRAISAGTSADGVPQQTTEYTGKSQIEFPVAHLFGEIVGDALNLLTIPRHRFGTVMNPIRSVNWNGYRWTATDGSNTAEQTTLIDTATFDVTGWTPPITTTVAQINRYTGPGPAVTEQFE